MGSGRGSRNAAARLWLRLHPGAPDRARIFGAAVGCAGRRHAAGGELDSAARRCLRRGDEGKDYSSFFSSFLIVVGWSDFAMGSHMHTEEKEPNGFAVGLTSNAMQQSKHFQCASATVLC